MPRAPPEMTVKPAVAAPPAADDCQGVKVARLKRSAHVKDIGWIGDLFQENWIMLIVGAEDIDILRLRPSELRIDLLSCCAQG